MVTFAHTAPDCAEIMWNEQNWTLVSMPIGSTRAQWDEGLRTVRQFNDLLRVLPPVPQQTSAPQSAGRRNAAPSRPLAPAGRGDAAPRRQEGHPEAPSREGGAAHRGTAASPPSARQEPTRRAPAEPGAPIRRQPPGRNGYQASNYQR
jgi:hypothetical protein